MSQSRMRPVLFLNPADDSAFRRCVDDAMADPSVGAGELQRRLRDEFPRAVVRPRDLASERLPVWYVYREGHWVAGESDPGTRDAPGRPESPGPPEQTRPT